MIALNEELTKKLPKMVGVNNQLISKEELITLLYGTDFENHRTVHHGFPIEMFPENYFITRSEPSKDSTTYQCGYNCLLNGFFLNEKENYLSVIFSIPIKLK